MASDVGSLDFQKARSWTPGAYSDPGAWSRDLGGRRLPHKELLPWTHSSSSVSSFPADLAAAGNDAVTPTAPAPGGEGEPHSQPRDALLGSTDKELKARAAVTGGSAARAPGTPWRLEPPDEAMDPGLWGSGWKEL